ncbi:MAG: rod shape-determining protein MreD [Lachnospiraceae bacterium]|nr:rod shape-determining protein MreD [Lachnospiraceae bacterium]
MKYKRINRTLVKIIAYAVMAVVLFVMQTSLFSHLKLAGVVPNLLMILTASAGIIGGCTDGSVTGFFCGIMADLVFGHYLGTYGLIYLVCGYAAGIVNRIFYKEDITFPLFTIAILDLVYGLYMYFISLFTSRGSAEIFLFALRRIILPEAAYTIIAAIFLYRFILYINGKIQRIGGEGLV